MDVEHHVELMLGKRVKWAREQACYDNDTAEPTAGIV